MFCWRLGICIYRHLECDRDRDTDENNFWNIMVVRLSAL